MLGITRDEVSVLIVVLTVVVILFVMSFIIVY